MATVEKNWCAKIATLLGMGEGFGRHLWLKFEQNGLKLVPTLGNGEQDVTQKLQQKVECGLREGVVDVEWIFEGMAMAQRKEGTKSTHEEIEKIRKEMKELRIKSAKEHEENKQTWMNERNMLLGALQEIGKCSGFKVGPTHENLLNDPTMLGKLTEHAKIQFAILADLKEMMKNTWKCSTESQLLAPGSVGEQEKRAPVTGSSRGIRGSSTPIVFPMGNTANSDQVPIVTPLANETQSQSPQDITAVKSTMLFLRGPASCPLSATDGQTSTVNNPTPTVSGPNTSAGSMPAPAGVRTGGCPSQRNTYHRQSTPFPETNQSASDLSRHRNAKACCSGSGKAGRSSPSGPPTSSAGYNLRGGGAVPTTRRTAKRNPTKVCKKVSDKPIDGLWACSCGVRCDQIGRLHQHVVSNNKDWKFKCKLCPHKAAYLPNLKRHMAQRHGVVNPLADCVEGCWLCGQMFKNSQDFKDHKKWDQ